MYSPVQCVYMGLLVCVHYECGGVWMIVTFPGHSPSLLLRQGEWPGNEAALSYLEPLSEKALVQSTCTNCAFLSYQVLHVYC